MFANLQAVRAIAALGVLFFHFGLMPPTSLPFTIGAAGVDLFFVLSGFIIAHSSARSSRHFLARRLIRVVPAYWIATLMAALVTLQSLDLRAAFDWLVQSMFYLPGPGGRPALIFVAWTLVYELAFYLLYWLALRLGVRRAPFVAMTMLLLLAVSPLPGRAGPWPLLLEFVFGIAIYLLTQRFHAFRTVRAPLGLVAAAAGLALLLILPRAVGNDPADYDGLGRALCSGLPAAAIILGLVIAEQGGLAIRSRPVLLLGAASYAIYLLHPITVGQLLQLPPNAPPLSWLMCLLAAALTTAIAVGFHLLVELRVIRALRRLLRERPPVEHQISAQLLDDAEVKPRPAAPAD